MQKRYTLKIPVTVEAIKITAENAKWSAAWCRGAIIEISNTVLVQQISGIGVPTLYGVKRAPLGSYLIKNVAGDFTFLEESDFRNKYISID